MLEITAIEHTNDLVKAKHVVKCFRKVVPTAKMHIRRGKTVYAKAIGTPAVELFQFSMAIRRAMKKCN